MTIRIEEVHYRYGEETRPALTDINLTLERGEVIVFCGPSGSGKTSLTYLINGLIPEFFPGDLTGAVFIDEKNLQDYSAGDISYQVGSVFQNPKNQFFNLNTTDELTFMAQNLNFPAEEIKERACKVGEEFNLENLLNRSIFAISGGEAQKIACAEITCADPDIIVLDEPSANLDFSAIKQLQKIIAKWKKNGKTVILAEHRLHYLWALADLFVYMQNGKIKKNYAAEELSNLPLADYHQLGLRARKLEEIFQAETLPKPREDNAPVVLTVKELSLKNPELSFVLPEKGFKEGHIYALIGNNGRGKSTFLKTLAGLSQGARGKLTWRGKTLTPRELTPYAYLVMQDVNHQLFMPSVFSEVELSLRGKKLTSHEKEEKITAILRALNLSDKINAHPQHLSGGEKQRLALAAAIAGEKPLLLFDEPTSGLDYYHMRQVSALIRQLAPERLILFVTHDPELIVHTATDIIYFPEEGALLNESLATETGQQLLQDFFTRALRDSKIS